MNHTYSVMSIKVYLQEENLSIIFVTICQLLVKENYTHQNLHNPRTTELER
mgnify:FL=1